MDRNESWHRDTWSRGDLSHHFGSWASLAIFCLRLKWMCHSEVLPLAQCQYCIHGNSVVLTTTWVLSSGKSGLTGSRTPGNIWENVVALLVSYRSKCHISERADERQTDLFKAARKSSMGQQKYLMKYIPDDGMGWEAKLPENLSHSHFSHL